MELDRVLLDVENEEPTTPIWVGLAIGIAVGLAVGYSAMADEGFGALLMCVAVGGCGGLRLGWMVWDSRIEMAAHDRYVNDPIRLAGLTRDAVERVYAALARFAQTDHHIDPAERRVLTAFKERFRLKDETVARLERRGRRVDRSLKLGRGVPELRLLIEQFGLMMEGKPTPTREEQRVLLQLDRLLQRAVNSPARAATTSA